MMRESITLDTYLAIIEVDGGQPNAHYSLATVRRMTETDHCSGLLDEGDFSTLSSTQLLYPDEDFATRRSFHPEDDVYLTATIANVLGGRCPDGKSWGDNVWLIDEDQNNTILSAHQTACETYFHQISNSPSGPFPAAISARARETGRIQVLAQWEEDCLTPYGDPIVKTTWLKVCPDGTTFCSERNLPEIHPDY